MKKTCLEYIDLSGDEMFVDVTTGENLEQDATVAEKEICTANPVTTADEVVTAAKDVEVSVAATIPQISKDELTPTQTLMEIKEPKPKAKGKPLKMKDQISFDKEVARKLEAKMKAKMEDEERIAREKEEANIAMIVEWDNTHAIMDAECELAAKLQEEERGELTIEEKSKKPPTKAEKRKKMCTYLKNMAGFTHNQLKSKSFKEVQQAFNKTIDLVNNFVAMDSESVEDRAVESSKRAGKELEQESAKKQKLYKQIQAIVADDDIAELKRCMEIVPKDDDYMFKNFNREDLEVLRSIVKERFKKTKPVDNKDNLLFQTLKTMFEHHIEYNIWKYQQSNHYKEPTELEIQEMVNILVSGELYNKMFNHLDMLHVPLEENVLIITTVRYDLQLIYPVVAWNGSSKEILSSREDFFIHEDLNLKESS
nr:hypothetical protein [Tanacetum cinerariifolium]